MRVLLDTHIFLWFIAGDGRLPRDLQVAITEPANVFSQRGVAVGVDDQTYAGQAAAAAGPGHLPSRAAPTTRDRDATID
jgi:hypothetical protein